MNDSPKEERILIVVDGENLIDFLLRSPMSLHEMIDACVRDFGDNPCRTVEGPALFLTVHDEEFDRRNEAGRLRHDLLSEIAVPKRCKYREVVSGAGGRCEKGYDDRRIMDYVMNRINKFDTLFMFSSDIHFFEFSEHIANDYDKAFLVCGHSGKAGHWLKDEQCFLDLATLRPPREPEMEREYNRMIGQKLERWKMIEGESFHERALRLLGRTD